MIFIAQIKSKIIDYFNIAKGRVMRSETYTIFLPTILACLFLLIFIPFLFNNSALQFQIEQKVSASLKANLEIEGDVDVALFPTLSVTAHDVMLRDYVSQGVNHNFYAKKVKIKLSFLASLMGDFAIDKIIFSDATLQSYDSENKPAKTSDAITEVIAKKDESLAAEKKVESGLSGKMFVSLFKIDEFDANIYNSRNFPKIILESCSWVSYNKLASKREISTIKAEINFFEKKIISQGSFLNQDILNNFDLKAHFENTSGKEDSVLNLNSAFGNFKITGMFFDKNIGLLKSAFKGTIEAEIFDLKSLYKSYVARDGFIYNKINPIIKPIKVKATIINDNKHLKINNIFVNSNIINGRGNIAVDLSQKLPLIDIDLSLENIDLDAVWLSEAQVILNDKAQEEAEQKKEEAVTDKPINTKEAVEDKKVIEVKKEDDLSLDIAKDLRDFDLTAEVSVSRVKYLEDEMKNVSLYATISKQGEILILPLKLEVPGGGVFRVTGVLENHEVPKFIGSLDASGTKLSSIFKWLHFESQNLIYENLKEYNIYANIMLVPNLTTLSNIYLNINNGKTEVLGDAKIYYNAKSSSILSNFRINHFVVDDYFLTSGQNIYLSPGSFLKKILWLNNLTSNNDVSLLFDSFSYKDSVFKDQSMKVRFGQGYFEVRDLKLVSDDINLEASFGANISGKNPEFNISVKSKNFVFNSIDNKTSNIEGGPILQQNNKINALDQFYALPSLDGFNGDVYLNLEDAAFDNFKAKNTLIAGKLKDGIINFTNFSSDIYEGNLIYRGAIGMKFDKQISGNAIFSEINLGSLLHDFSDIKNIDGTANISASVECSSGTRQGFANNLISSIKFSAANLSVEGYGLNDLIKKMFNVKNYQEQLRDPEKILLNQNATTNFKHATGTISMAKGRESEFKIDLKTVAANAIVSGKFNLGKKSINASNNVIFLTGTAKKQIPLNIASNVTGQFGDIEQSVNLNQVKQYLGLPYVANASVELEPEPSNDSNLDQNNAMQQNQNIDLEAQKSIDGVQSKIRDYNVPNNPPLP